MPLWARWLIGFGAGRSRVFLVESLEDPGTKDIVAKYTGYGMDWTAPLGSQFIAKMRSDAVTISHCFGGLVSKLPEQEPDPQPVTNTGAVVTTGPWFSPGFCCGGRMPIALRRTR